MRLLLDTHVFLWSFLDPDRLGPDLAAVLEAPDSELWLSPISVWETLVLADKGRLALEPDAEAWVRAALRRVPFREPALNREVAIESRRVALPHQDPADRFLAATATVYDLTLVTADSRLLEGVGFRTMAVGRR